MGSLFAVYFITYTISYSYLWDQIEQAAWAVWNYL